MTGDGDRSGRAARASGSWVRAAWRRPGRSAAASDLDEHAMHQAEAVRRGMVVTVLAARCGIAALTEAASPDTATVRSAADTAATIRRAALELIRSVDHGSTPAPDLEGVRTMALCSYDDASAVGDWHRRGEPLVVDMAGASDDCARRLGDFIAGLVSASRGTVSRVGFRQLLIRPAEAGEDDPDPGQLPGPETAIALDEVVHVATVVSFSLDIPAGNTAERVLPHVRSLIATLRSDSLPLDVGGLDLSRVDLGGTDLRGMVWTPATTWPDQAVAAQVRDASAELRPGVFKVTTDQQFVVGAPHALPAGEA
jgi:hypothetical protein